MNKITIVTTLFVGLVIVPNSFAGNAAVSDVAIKVADNEVLRLSDPVASDSQSETFGLALDQSLPTVTLSQLTENSGSYLGKTFQVQTKVAKVCQKKGCFFIAQQGDDVMRVAFKDYGFFVPTDSAGKIVTLSGELVKKEMTAEQVAHFKMDMQSGSDAVKEGVVYEILASSVKIPRA